MSRSEAGEDKRLLVVDSANWSVVRDWNPLCPPPALRVTPAPSLSHLQADSPTRRLSRKVEEIPIDLGPRHFSLDLSALGSADAAALSAEDVAAAGTADSGTAAAVDGGGGGVSAVALAQLRMGDRIRCTLPEDAAASADLPPALKALQERGARVGLDPFSPSATATACAAATTATAHASYGPMVCCCCFSPNLMTYMTIYNATGVEVEVLRSAAAAPTRIAEAESIGAHRPEENQRKHKRQTCETRRRLFR